MTHLALAAVVDVGGVEEGDAALDRAPDDRLGLRLVERPRPLLVPAEAHHPQAHARHAQAGVAEIDVLHCVSRLRSRLSPRPYPAPDALGNTGASAPNRYVSCR